MSNMVKIGFVGVGAISGIYLKNLSTLFDNVEIIGVCDLIRERAEKAVKEYNIPKLYNDMYELFADDEVDIVLNITRPDEHYEVTKAALSAGKHVYSEKPLASTFAMGKQLTELAKEKGLLLGGAPDTFMGAGIQTCRELLDSGAIGTPIGAAAHLICHGHESWHPDPEFYYKRGGGPMMDMGPYYITALVYLLGDVKQVAGMTKISFSERKITSEPHNGEIIKVDVPTYTVGLLNFCSGVTGTVFTTFDVWYKNGEKLEIYGTEGTLCVPDPNCFGGTVKIINKDGVREIPLTFDFNENSRGLGVADMAKALTEKKSFKADYRQTLHVLEILESFEKSSRENTFVNLETSYTRATPMGGQE